MTKAERKKRERSAGAFFFCEDLAAAEREPDDNNVATERARGPSGGAIDMGLLRSDLWRSRRELRRSFATTEPPHALFVGALDEKRARAVKRALDRSAFVPHHHAAYALRVAREPHAGELGALTSWLKTPAAARLHMKLVGYRHDRALTKVQVQVSRMEAGESFPPHIDTDEDGLAAVYNFSEDVSGGELVFTASTLRVPPLWNVACVFETKNREHAVLTVTEGRRHSVTAFWLVQSR